ncbi:hypothetical protein [Aquirufa sp. A-Brett2-W8]
MELKDLKDFISIIYFIKSLTDEALKLSDNSEVQFLYITNEIDSEEYFNRTIGKRIEFEINLKLLDVALISFKIEDEEKYFKLKKEILELNSECQYLYTLPETPPNILSNHIRDLQVFQFVKKSSTDQLNESAQNSQTEVKEEEEIPEFEISTIPDRVRLLMELGIIEHLEKELPILKDKKKKLTELLMQFLNIPYNSLQPVVNAIGYDDDNPRKPKLTKKVQNVLNKYK